MSTLEEIEAAVPRLSTEDLERLENRLRELRHQRKQTHEPVPTSLAEFSGVLSLTEDPLAWQHQVRGEWQ